jgi:8-oxo-dGTP pyrophosphatase MutT (NUDIX family)
MRITGRQTVWQGSFIRAIVLRYEDSSGAERSWEAAERVNCNGIVAVVPVTTDGELLLVRQYRPVLDNFVIEFPAGLNDRRESLVAAAKRELIEETGYTSEHLSYLIEGPISSGISTEVLTVFLAKDVRPAAPDVKRRYPSEETERITLVRSPFSRVYEVLDAAREKGDYEDIKIFGLLELARRRL